MIGSHENARLVGYPVNALLVGYPWAQNPFVDWKYEREFANMYFGDVSDNSVHAYVAMGARRRAALQREA